MDSSVQYLLSKHYILSRPFVKNFVQQHLNNDSFSQSYNYLASTFFTFAYFNTSLSLKAGDKYGVLRARVRWHKNILI